jgi:hypothetical protein
VGLEAQKAGTETASCNLKIFDDKFKDALLDMLTAEEDEMSPESIKRLNDPGLPTMSTRLSMFSLFSKQFPKRDASTTALQLWGRRGWMQKGGGGGGHMEVWI